MQIAFIPGSLMEKWQLPSHSDSVPAENLDDIAVKNADIIVISDARLQEVSSDKWPLHRMVVDAAETPPGLKQVRNWLLNGARTVVLNPSERTALFIGLRDVVSPDAGFQGIIGNSPQMKELREIIEKVAHTSATVLIRGESGTGKELVAQAVHSLSPRKNRPFVPVNCAAIPETLLEDDLFGHVKGAFTDARTDRKGKLEEADGGTLFLDEIGDMVPALQVKLLRVLQEKEIQPLGSNRPRKVDVRIIAATAADLEGMIKKKAFREDLYFRLNVIPIPIPPLRERMGDIPELISHFSRILSAKHGLPELQFTESAMNALINRQWQGNVRELEHFIERMLVLFDGTGPVNTDALCSSPEIGRLS
ncbi:MAG: AAA domain-containing protein [Acidobacteria bacterium]|nr:AAA domain-containing protein [Acidobacteriota bacterium]